MIGGGKSDGCNASGDKKTGRNLSLVLMVGLCVAVALLLMGVVLALVRPGISIPGKTSLSGMPRAVAALEPDGFFTLGFLILLVTPVANVVAMLINFLGSDRDRLFSGLAILVLLVIVASAYLGLRG